MKRFILEKYGTGVEVVVPDDCELQIQETDVGVLLKAILDRKKLEVESDETI